MAQFKPISPISAHREFPVDVRAELTSYVDAVNFFKITAPPEFDIDGAGGLIYYTPQTLGTFNITIGARLLSGQEIARTSFIVTVDDNTMLYPQFRDYLWDSTITVTGRTLSNYTLSYYHNNTPNTVIPITTGGAKNGTLALWDISTIPDGSRITMVLTVGQSVLKNEVIIDKTLKWTKRLSPLTHSIISHDINADGKEEFLAVSHFGELFAYDIEGNQLFKTSNFGATYCAPSVGNDEIVWMTERTLYTYSFTGQVKKQFAFPAVELGRVTPTLADINGDGILEILVPTLDFGGRAELFCFDKNLNVLWRKPIGKGSYASASVADLDGDGKLEIVIASDDRLYSFRSNGLEFSPLHNKLFHSKIQFANTIGGGSSYATSQPAIYDIDKDGKLEIIVGTNIFRSDTGQFQPGWSTPKPGVSNTVSASVGDVFGIKISIGNALFNAQGVLLKTFPERMYSTAMIGREQVYAGGESSLTAYKIVGNYERANAYPKTLFGSTLDTSAPIINDFDGDGLIEIAVAFTDASYGGIIAVYKTNIPFHEDEIKWGMLGNNKQHTGYGGTAVTPPPSGDSPIITDTLLSNNTIKLIAQDGRTKILI